MSKRGLSDKFIETLIDEDKGILNSILDLVQCDNTLDLQIREDEVHIYYRGGKILGIKPKGNLTEDIKFKFSFDTKYSKTSDGNDLIDGLPKCISSKKDAGIWVESLPLIKQIMDYYFTSISEKNEREFQQLVVRENNYSTISNSTDYFIADIEYADSYINARFDLIAIKWDSISQNRAWVDKHLPKLVFIEMKYADGALSGDSGLKKHIKDIEGFLAKDNNLKDLKEEMIRIFEQKRKLGLIKFGSAVNTNPINKLSDEKPELILLLANHDPGSKILRAEFEEIHFTQNIELKVATSSFMGYGLYNETIYPIEDFKVKFEKQIYSGK